METIEGKNLNEFVLMNKNRCRPKSKLSKTKQKHKFFCSHCGKGFLQRSKYIIHKSLHNKIIQYGCMECENVFSNKEELTLHQKTACHSGEKLIESKNEIDSITNENSHGTEEMVEISKLSTESDSNMKNDEDYVESSTTEESRNLESKDDDDSHKCVKCNKHFQSQDALENHVKVVHHGEKPFLCELCHKTFSYESSLKGHKEMYHSVRNGNFFFLRKIIEICIPD